MKGNLKCVTLFFAATFLASVTNSQLLGDPNTFVVSGTGTTTVKADTAVL